MCQSDNDLTELKAFDKYAATHIVNEESALEVSDSIWDGYCDTDMITPFILG